MISLVLVIVSLFPEALAISGTSNANGYVVLDYFHFDQCEGSIEEKFAVAVDTCVPGGLRLEPYGGTHFIYTINSVSGLVEANTYTDSQCTDFREMYESFPFDSCSTAGSPVYYSFSATVPNFTLDNGAIQYVAYENETASEQQESENCDHDDDIVEMYALYTPSCILNCFFEGEWQYCSFDACVQGSALLTYSNESTCGNETGSLITNTSCATNDEITCLAIFVPPDDNTPDGNNDSSGDDDSLSGITIGIIISGAVVVAVAAAVATYYFCMRSRKGGLETTEINDGSDLQRPLNAP